MDQERIGTFIKEIRTKNKLSQSAFANKYGVTYQAVSKWENGKNIPDLAILKQICSDYNMSLEELLNGKKNSQNNKTKTLVLFTISIMLVIALALGILFIINKDDKQDFEFKTLSSTSEQFKLTGSIAYNQDKTSIYITDITYSGNDKKVTYKSIKSTLYEIDNKTKTEVSTYNKTFKITLEEFLSGLSYNIDNHARICEEYTEESLLIEILATDKQGKITKYEIPIKISDNCNHKSQ